MLLRGAIAVARRSRSKLGARFLAFARNKDCHASLAMAVKGACNDNLLIVTLTLNEVKGKGLKEILRSLCSLRMTVKKGLAMTGKRRKGYVDAGEKTV